MLTELITGEAFTDLFRGFDHTAYRLEVRTAYAARLGIAGTGARPLR